MPVYVYRREDGTTFEVRQSFSDAPLTVDPSTGQKVARIVQNAGVIFKGSGFYVTDSKNASKQPLTSSNNQSSTEGASTESTSTETKSEKSTEAAPVAPTSSTTAPAASTTAAAAD